MESFALYSLKVHAVCSHAEQGMHIIKEILSKNLRLDVEKTVANRSFIFLFQIKDVLLLRRICVQKLYKMFHCYLWLR